MVSCDHSSLLLASTGQNVAGMTSYADARGTSDHQTMQKSSSCIEEANSTNSFTKVSCEPKDDSYHVKLGAAPLHFTHAREHRFQSMRRMNMFDEPCGDHVHFHTVDNGDADLDETINSLFVKFNKMDSSGQGLVSARDLQAQIDTTHKCRSRPWKDVFSQPLHDILKDFNMRMKYVADTDSMQRAYQINFAAFIEMMLMEDMNEQIHDKQLVEDICHIRRLLMKNMATGTLADKARLHASEFDSTAPADADVPTLEVLVGIAVLLNVVLIGVSTDYIQIGKAGMLWRFASHLYSPLRSVTG